jgi:hypothetical protein
MPSQRVRTKEYTHFFKSYQQANTKWHRMMVYMLHLS